MQKPLQLLYVVTKLSRDGTDNLKIFQKKKKSFLIIKRLLQQTHTQQQTDTQTNIRKATMTLWGEGIHSEVLGVNGQNNNKTFVTIVGVSDCKRGRIPLLLDTLHRWERKGLQE